MKAYIYYIYIVTCSESLHTRWMHVIWYFHLTNMLIFGLPSCHYYHHHNSGTHRCCHSTGFVKMRCGDVAQICGTYKCVCGAAC